MALDRQAVAVAVGVAHTHGALLWQGRRTIESWEEIAGLTEAAWRDHEHGLAH